MQDPKIKAMPLLAALALLPGCTGTTTTDDWFKAGSAILGGGQAKTYSISDGLREALRVGTETVVQQVGVTDGFNGDRAIRIPLPQRLHTMRTWLERIGMGTTLNDLEVRLNRAAEVAAPKAKRLFWQSIRQMTLADAKAIFHGPQDAATQYFRRTMTPQLRAEMSPLVTRSLAQVGAIQRYEEIVARYATIPGAAESGARLENHFGQPHARRRAQRHLPLLAQEEAAIRANPAKRTTEILRAVFGSGR